MMGRKGAYVCICTCTCTYTYQLLAYNMQVSLTSLYIATVCRKGSHMHLANQHTIYRSPITGSENALLSLIVCGCTLASMGNSMGAVFTTRTTFPAPGVSMMAKKG